MRIATGILLFAVAWLLWSGHYTPLLLALGAASCVLVTVIAWNIGFFDRDVYTLHMGRRLVFLWLWLFKGIVRANVKVAGIVLNPKARITPKVVSMDASDLPPPCQAILANAITLTPGTASLDINDGWIKVHCLSEEIADELLEGDMQRQVRRLLQE